ncbi:MAG: hypothetical protein WBF93_22045, partial [Pirellulales bacterium]
IRLDGMAFRPTLSAAEGEAPYRTHLAFGHGDQGGHGLKTKVPYNVPYDVTCWGPRWRLGSELL